MLENTRREISKFKLRLRRVYLFIYVEVGGRYREKLDSGENKVHLWNWKGIQLFYLGRDT